VTAPKTNLVVVAHPDDEILGFGATGAKLAAAGDIVQAIILCGNVDARSHRPADEELFADMNEANHVAGFQPPVLGDFPNIRMNNVDHIDIVQFIEKQVAHFQPHRIFTHHGCDLNDDHKQINRAALAAARLFQRRADVRPLEELSLMEVPSATDWSFGDQPGFVPNTFVEIGPFLDVKLDALRCYRNVMRDYPHPRSPEALRGLAAIRGAQAGLRLAEAFQTVFRTTLG
jgi:LmbE family N-acetylglucosaminyl deacetylase